MRLKTDSLKQLVCYFLQISAMQEKLNMLQAERGEQEAKLQQEVGSNH